MLITYHYDIIVAWHASCCGLFGTSRNGDMTPYHLYLIHYTYDVEGMEGGSLNSGSHCNVWHGICIITY